MSKYTSASAWTHSAKEGLSSMKRESTFQALARGGEGVKWHAQGIRARMDGAGKASHLHGWTRWWVITAPRPRPGRPKSTPDALRLIMSHLQFCVYQHKTNPIHIHGNPPITIPPHLIIHSQGQSLSDMPQTSQPASSGSLTIIQNGCWPPRHAARQVPALCTRFLRGAPCLCLLQGGPVLASGPILIITALPRGRNSLLVLPLTYLQLPGPT